MPRPLADGQFHAFVSHHWDAGQDQASAIKARLLYLAPGLRVFLDVDDLSDLRMLEEHVRNSDVLLVFLAGRLDASGATHSDYFRSANWCTPASALPHAPRIG